MKAFRTYHLQRFISLLLTIVVLNVSIDAPDVLKNLDGNPLTLEEDLSINDMESVVEVILEKGLEIDNAVPENDEADQNQFIKKIDCFTPLLGVSLTSLVYSLIPAQSHITYDNSIFEELAIDITPPPPKA